MCLLVSNTGSCDEDDDEVSVDVLQELVDEPRTTNGIQFDTLQSMALFGEMWFLTAGEAVYP